MVYGNLKIDLKGSKVEIVEPKNWLQKFARIFTGDKKLKKQVVTQMQYIENVAKVFEELGWKNVVLMEVNGKTVYEDEAHTDDDLRIAIEAAMKEEQKDMYHVQVNFEKLDAEKNEETLTIDMYNQGEVDTFPLNVEVDLLADAQGTKDFLNLVLAKVNEKFGTESQEIEVDEDYNELDYEEDEDEDDSIEETEEEAEVTEEEPKAE